MTKDQFRLICGGKLLEDKDTLKGLKLTDGSSVYLLPKSKPQVYVQNNVIKDFLLTLAVKRH